VAWSTVGSLSHALLLPSLTHVAPTEPMTDLFAVFSKLVTPAGEILVPGIADKVAPLTPEEKARYEVIDISVRRRSHSTSSDN
jgi:hypothetical protein